MLAANFTHGNPTASKSRHDLIRLMNNFSKPAGEVSFIFL